MTVSVDLTVARRPAATTLTSEAVRGATSPTPYVLLVRDGRVQRQEVTLGIRGEGSIEITTGLEPGLEVIVPDGTVVQPNQRVRPSREER